MMIQESIGPRGGEVGGVAECTMGIADAAHDKKIFVKLSGFFFFWGGGEKPRRAIGALMETERNTNKKIL